MRRDLRRDPAYQVVRGLTLSRLVCGLVLLPICGWNGWWLAAAIVFALGFATDMLDGAAARAWHVTTPAGARLDTNADAALTFGALLAVTVSGGWHWLILALLSAAFVTLGWWESQLRGDALGVFILAVPAVNLTLIALLEARFVQLAGGSFAAALSIEIVVGVVIGCFKRYRIGDYLRMAIDRSRE